MAVNILLAAVFMSAASAAETNYTKNPETGIESWEWREGGVTLQLGQITPGLAQGSTSRAASTPIPPISLPATAPSWRSCATNPRRENSVSISPTGAGRRHTNAAAQARRRMAETLATPRRANRSTQRVSLGAATHRAHLRGRRPNMGHVEHGGQASGGTIRSSLSLEDRRGRTARCHDEHPLRRR